MPPRARFATRAAAWLLGFLFTAAAQAQALVTLLDGEATVIEHAQRSSAVPGLALDDGAIVETGPSTALVRIEWPDGGTADLGAATRVMLSPPGWPARGGRAPRLYLLQGWVKLAGNGREPAGGVLTPSLEVLPFSGAAVVAAERRERQAFAETGALEVLERAGGKRHALPPGALFDGAAGVLPRPEGSFLARVPRAFRDPLPHRAAAFRDRRVAAPALPPPSYAQVADWLIAEPAIRRDFPRRFAAWAGEPAFRQALLAHESAHPEWRPVLHPLPPPSSPAR